MDRLIAIGDIHGCYHTLTDLLKDVDYSSAKDTLVFVGDYIDRGNFSYEVVTILKKMQQQAGEDKVICLRGNHEQMAIDAFEHDYNKETEMLDIYGESTQIWFYNGGEATLQSFQKHGENLMSYIPWFKSLPLIYDTPEILFCHAGLSKPMVKDNTENDILWGRDWINTDARCREKQVIFGHTPGNERLYTTKSGDICIDAGCVFGGRLCGLIIHENGKCNAAYVLKAEADKT